MYLLLDRFALEVLQKLNESSTYTDHRKLTKYHVGFFGQLMLSKHECFD